MEKKAVIFDMDGVLVDVQDSYRLAIKKTVARFNGTEPTDQEIQDLKNKGGFNNDWALTLELIRKKVSMSEMIPVFQSFYLGKDYDGFIQNEKWLLKRPVIKELDEKYLLGIVTGRPRDEAIFALKKADMLDFFKVIITMDDTDEQKPDPIILQIAMQKLESKMGYYVGDCVDDMLMASAAGVVPVGIAKDEATVRLLSIQGAKKVIDDVNKIIEVLE